MCGIFGFSGIGDKKDLARMDVALAHRGPDANDVWIDKSHSLYLGHRRLAIIDLSDGAQPMATKDGDLCIVFNGEIFNHKELRQELEKKGYIFQTSHSDTEVLLHGYREWGKILPKKLNGMWAFTIYDKNKGQIFISRDRFGQKPLFYTKQNGTFAFASELSALIEHSNVTKTVSTKSIQKYFAYGYIPAPGSLYKNIYKLPAGNNMIVSLENQDIHIEKYWDFELEPFENIPKNPEEVWGEQLRDLIENAVKRRMVSDVPLGVFLSGGIDSSAITAFASKHSANRKLLTFSIGFEEASFNESNFAKHTSELFNTNHYCDTMSIDKALSIIPHITKHLDEPMGDSSLIPTYLLCKDTRKHVTVALGGDGADELFAGYDPFLALSLSNLYSKIVPKSIHPAIQSLTSFLPTHHTNMSLDFKIKRVLRGLSYKKELWNPVWMGPLSPKELSELYLSPVNTDEIYSEAIEQWDTCKQTNLIDKTLQFFTKLYMIDDINVKVDRASMLNSLEVRSPFLDIELVDFVRKIPSDYKFRNNQTKYILKKALEPILPKEIINRSKKGFGIPIGKWFKDDSLSFGENNTNHSYFLQKRLKEHIAGRNDHRVYLWNQWLLNQFIAN